MKISVIGAGSRGLTLSDVLAFNQHDVLVYTQKESEAQEINTSHTSTKYLHGLNINESISATGSLEEGLDFSQYILLAIPSNAILSCIEEIKKIRPDSNYFFINAIKGLNLETNQTIQQILSEHFPNNKGLVSLLGPSFASEVIKKDITCICSVSSNENDATFVQKLFTNEYFRVYIQTDVIGAELYSSMKNAIAIASGIVNGLGYGENTKAGLITLGLKEMARIGKIMGAKDETFFGLTGLGDLILTCSSNLSRNFQAGYEIGKADSAEEFLKTNTTTVEGIATIATIENIAKEKNLELPIIHALYSIIYENVKPSEILKEIMKRPSTREG